ncbi:Hsp20/alpha crystallin family protein [Candidatus Nomurabacteria bacterium]|nr:Hsp20/alpha crystallin family protein [Candidatus Nomurabacteria bacterium]
MKNKSFLERLTGSIRLKDEEEDSSFLSNTEGAKKISLSDKGSMETSKDYKKESSHWEEEEDAQLTIDVYQTPADIIIQTMVAGVQPENLSITITRSMVVIKGKREESRSVATDDYYVQELYWGSFSRTISLPEEVDPEEAEAVEKHGLLRIKMPKINKDKETKLKIKSI